MSAASPSAAPKLEFVCTLQLPVGSPQLAELERRRQACENALGVDETHLYPLHVTVVGVFVATREEVAAVCNMARSLIAKAATDALAVDVQAALAPPASGHVLLDVVAPGAAALAQRLTQLAGEAGVVLRPKAVRHMSLASKRSPEEQRSILCFYQNLRLGRCDMDLLVSEQLLRSDLRRLREQGQRHVFRDVLRLPVSRAAPALHLPGLLHSPPLATPTKPRKRTYEEGCVVAGMEVDDQTPPKICPQKESQFCLTPLKCA